VALGLWLTAVVSADVIQLRSGAAVDTPAVTLRDVAELDGPEAERWADVSIHAWTESQTSKTLSLDELRRLLDARGVHWGRLTLRGPASIVIRRTAPAVTRTIPAAHAAANPMAPVTVAEPAGQALRQRIIDWVRQHVAADESDLRIGFDEQQAALLDAVNGQRLEFEPLNRDRLGRIPLVIREHRSDLLAATHRVHVMVELRRMAVVARRNLDRGHLIGEGDVELKPVWLNSSIKQPATDPAAVVGRKMSVPLRSGAVVHVDDVSATVGAVRRGDKVLVRCVSGAVVVRTEARAMEDGAIGQIISLKREGLEGRRSTSDQAFTARITGPGEAVAAVESASGAMDTAEGQR
jgi:flagella basal body P-ring formation protein FlgA